MHIEVPRSPVAGWLPADSPPLPWPGSRPLLPGGSPGPNGPRAWHLGEGPAPFSLALDPFPESGFKEPHSPLACVAGTSELEISIYLFLTLLSLRNGGHQRRRLVFSASSRPSPGSSTQGCLTYPSRPGRTLPYPGHTDSCSAERRPRES